MTPNFTSRQALGGLLVGLTLTTAGCAGDPSAASDDQDATEIATDLGEMTLTLADDQEVALPLRSSLTPFAFRAGYDDCVLGSDARRDGPQWLLCGSVYLIRSDQAYEARLAGTFIDSEPICSVWYDIVGFDVPEALCFPAGTYDDEASDPTLTLHGQAASGNHPFAIADAVDEAVADLVGVVTPDGRTVSTVSWSIYSGDAGALQLSAGYEDGSTSSDCYTSTAPRILTDNGTLDPQGAVAEYAQQLSEHGDTFCTP